MQKRSSPLKQIAEIVGVSKMTVSRALREGTPVAPALRERIRETAQKLGYQPDSLISQAMRAVRMAQSSNYRENLAFVWPDRMVHTVDSTGMAAEILEGARDRAQELGYRIDEFHLAHIPRMGDALSSILSARSIRGVIVGPGTLSSAPPLPKLDWPQFSCVLLGRSHANLGLPRVQHDDYLGCGLAMRRLDHLRYQRIALVVSSQTEERTARLVRSAFSSFHPLGTKESEKMTFTLDGENMQPLKKCIEREKPEALLALFGHDFPNLERLHTVAPGNCSIVSLNWNRRHPEIAGIDQHPVRMGAQAVDLLLLRIHSSQQGLDPLAPTIQIPGSWKNGLLVKRQALCETK